MTKILTPQTLDIYRDRILTLYDPCEERREKYSEALTHTSLIIIETQDEGVIGCLRILTDFFQSAVCSDLIVHPDHQRKGVATRLMEMGILFCTQKKIMHLELIADSKYPWLVDFYKNLGFKIDPTCGLYMSYADKGEHITVQV